LIINVKTLSIYIKNKINIIPINCLTKISIKENNIKLILTLIFSQTWSQKQSKCFIKFYNWNF